MLVTVIYAIIFSIDVTSSVKLTPRVVTPSGPLIGTTIQARGGRTIFAFLGIPFGIPPLGNLRFEPPLPVQPWTQERQANKQPQPCYQVNAPDSSEDCLYLNVYTPNLNPTCPMAVAVYMYSGGYDFGSAAEYTPEYILEEANILYVAIQYRVNMFGWFSTGDSVVPGNMGLKDVLLALTWVQNNICSFGGDPAKVTVWGESNAAAMSHFLAIYAADRGLFRSAISSSQSVLSPRSYRPPVEVARRVPVFAKLYNCPSNTSELVACLKEKSAKEILDVFINEFKYGQNMAVQQTYATLVSELGPVLEPKCVKGSIITCNPWTTRTTIPWLTGLNSKESLFHFIIPLNDETNLKIVEFNANFDTTYPLLLNYEDSSEDSSHIPQAVRHWYLHDQPISKTTLPQSVDAFSDPFFIYPSYEAIQRANKEKTFVYYFEHIGADQLFPVPEQYRVGVSHGEDLLYFFPHPGTTFQTVRMQTESDIRLSKTLIKLWTNFIINLNPNFPNQEGINWKPFSCSESYLYIKQEGFEERCKFLPKRMEFWRNQPYPGRDENLGDVPCH